jgi:hypothetical protein
MIKHVIKTSLCIDFPDGVINQCIQIGDFIDDNELNMYFDCYRIDGSSELYFDIKATSQTFKEDRNLISIFKELVEEYFKIKPTVIKNQEQYEVY